MTTTGVVQVGAAQQFAMRYADASSEKQLAQSFWRDLLTDVCEVGDLRASGIQFEYPVRSSTTGKVGFIDVLWPGVLLVEHKSAGSDLAKAEQQAREYLVSLEAALRPPTIIVSDFQRVRIIEVLAGRSAEFNLSELPENAHRLTTIIGDSGKGAARVEVEADARAAELMSDLFEAFEEAGYTGHDVSVFLVRTLLLLFGDDTQLWPRGNDGQGLFQSLVSQSSRDGSGLGGTVQELFQVLNTPRDARPKTLAASLAAFPYVNGGLFAETLPVFSFTREMRDALVATSQYDWSSINPSIFGAMFQNIKSREDRRELGQHYTSEANINKVIEPLFIDEFEQRLRDNWDAASKLRAFHSELSTWTFVDPACGCGNFLLVAYKRLRELDLRLTARILELEGQRTSALDGTWLLAVKLSQFHGIEYEPWSSEIAKVALFLAEHQSNIAMEKVLGTAPSLLPLSDAANITTGNALRMDWSELFPMNERTVFMGNPPFTGSSFQNAEQKADTELVWANNGRAGLLDYVTNWFKLTAVQIRKHGGRAAFVATNSISQGEQPPVLWGELAALGMSIDFAHRPFQWSNDASGQAAVHTVIVGFSGLHRRDPRPLWRYERPDAPPVRKLVERINGYLLPMDDVLVTSRRTPLSPDLPPLDYGSKPTDDGLLSNISADEAEQMRREDPVAARYLRRIVGARELLHDEERWCLWLADAEPADLRRSAELRRRVDQVAQYRSASTKAKTRADALRPHEFQEIRQPRGSYIAVPLVSSENRDYLAVQRFDADVVTNNLVSIINDDSLVAFGVLSSLPFWLWAKVVSGRLESRIRISGSITYNNFPLPHLTPDQREGIEKAADGILVARSTFVRSTLADLYSVPMPTQLRKAHERLDVEVMKVFGLSPKATEDEILACLFDRYSAATSGLLPPPRAPRKRKAA